MSFAAPSERSGVVSHSLISAPAGGTEAPHHDGAAPAVYTYYRLIRGETPANAYQIMRNIVAAAPDTEVLGSGLSTPAIVTYPKTVQMLLFGEKMSTYGDLTAVRLAAFPTGIACP